MLVTVCGVLALSFMMLMYALEDRGKIYTLGFAAGCALSSIYGFLANAWPFGVVELIWSGVALRRYQRAIHHRTREVTLRVDSQRTRPSDQSGRGQCDDRPLPHPHAASGALNAAVARPAVNRWRSATTAAITTSPVFEALT